MSPQYNGLVAGTECLLLTNDTTGEAAPKEVGGAVRRTNLVHPYDTTGDQRRS